MKQWSERAEDQRLGAAEQLVGRGRRGFLTLDEPGAERDRQVLARADPYVVSVPEAARLLGISKDLAYDLARRGELPGAFQLGRRWRVSLIRLHAAVHGTEDGAARPVG